MSEAIVGFGLKAGFPFEAWVSVEVLSGSTSMGNSARKVELVESASH
jgi:hypothetical protein